MIINVRDEDKEKLSKRLVENNFSPTHIASTGEFLHFGKSIFLLGVEADKVDEVSKIINECTNANHGSERSHTRNEWYVLDTLMVQK